MEVYDLVAFGQMPPTNLLNIPSTLLQLSQILNQCVFAIMVFLSSYSIITNNHMTFATLHNTIAIEHFVGVNEHTTDVLVAMGTLYANK